MTARTGRLMNACVSIIVIWFPVRSLSNKQLLIFMLFVFPNNFHGNTLTNILNKAHNIDPNKRPKDNYNA